MSEEIPSFGQKTRPCPELEIITLLNIDDKSGPGGLLPKEIPGILNICADREPTAICPVNSYAASLS